MKDNPSIKSLEDRLKQAESSLKEYKAIQDARERYQARGLQVTIRELSKANSSLEKAEKRLQEQNQRLEELDQLKDQFLAIASHDLRAPLGNIKGLAFLLKDRLSSAEMQDELELISNIEQAADYTMDLVKNLFDHTLIQTGAFTISKKLSNLNEVMKRVVNMNLARANRKAISFDLECDTDLGDSYFDELRIEQVLQNLVSNAIKFSYRNSKVNLVSRREEELATISIIDEGQGIPDNEISVVFDPYTTTSTKPTGSERSTGLGLSIAKQIMQAHGGDISVSSELNVGSHFKVMLPI